MQELSEPAKFNLLGVLIDAVDYRGAVAKIMDAARRRERYTCSALAVHGVMTGVRDAEHRYRLNSLDLVVPDGQPVRWGLRLLHGVALPDRVYGPRLTLEVCRAASQEGLPVFFFGSRPEVLERMCANLSRRLPSLRIAGAEPSRFRALSERETQELADRIRESGAAIMFVGLGCPRQEVFAYEFGRLLELPILAVGAAFDFHAGTLPQAPPVMQRYGLEWLYRLSKEPRRLWKRYALLNPLYLIYLAAQWTGRRFPPDDVEAPRRSLRFG